MTGATPEVFERQVEALCQSGDVLVGTFDFGQQQKCLRRPGESAGTGGLHRRHDRPQRRSNGSPRRRLPARSLHRYCAHPGRPYSLRAHSVRMDGTCHLHHCRRRVDCTTEPSSRKCPVIANLPEVIALVESGWRNVRALVVGDVDAGQVHLGRGGTHFAGGAGPGSPRHVAERAAWRRSQRGHEPCRTGGLRHRCGVRRRRRRAEEIGIACWPRREWSRP